ncbi:DUF7601 domain-containing protein [Butyrivibrio sp. MC2013]|uniref:DUF7601 domain-containing protein n=1 Tax=Butyrivibrio sp. MC2013 TaxID=1280686 RepID=UPI00047E0B66|nr:hypothetical protein [Butyrivibrio sp. MC2013]
MSSKKKILAFVLTATMFMGVLQGYGFAAHADETEGEYTEVYPAASSMPSPEPMTYQEEESSISAEQEACDNSDEDLASEPADDETTSADTDNDMIPADDAASENPAETGENADESQTSEDEETGDLITDDQPAGTDGNADDITEETEEEESSEDEENLEDNEADEEITIIEDEEDPLAPAPASDKYEILYKEVTISYSVVEGDLKAVKDKIEEDAATEKSASDIAGEACKVSVTEEKIRIPYVSEIAVEKATASKVSKKTKTLIPGLLKNENINTGNANADKAEDSTDSALKFADKKAADTKCEELLDKTVVKGSKATAAAGWGLTAWIDEEGDEISSESLLVPEIPEKDVSYRALFYRYEENEISAKAQDGAVISIKGYLPKGAYVKASVPGNAEMESVKAELEEGGDKEVIYAYDIKICFKDAKGKEIEYQPGSDNKVEVTITPADKDDESVLDSFSDEEFLDKIYDLDFLDGEDRLFHISDEGDGAEEVEIAVSEDNSIVFEAEGFSIYAVTNDKVQGLSTSDLYLYLVGSDRDNITVYFTGEENAAKRLILVDRTAGNSGWTSSNKNVILTRLDGKSDSTKNNWTRNSNNNPKTNVSVNGKNAQVSFIYADVSAPASSQTSYTATVNYGSDKLNITVKRLGDLYVEDMIAESQEAFAGNLRADISEYYDADEALEFVWESSRDGNSWKEVDNTVPGNVRFLASTDERNWKELEKAENPLQIGSADTNAVANKVYACINAAIDSGYEKVSGSDRLYYRLVIRTAGDDRKVLATSEEYQIPYYTELQNVGFEEQNMSNGVKKSDTMYNFSNGTPGLIWKSTGITSDANQDIEILKYNSDDLSGWISHGATDGGEGNNYFAELNAEAAGTLYQDMITAPGSTLNWSISHRARHRAGKDDEKLHKETVVSSEIDYYSLSQSGWYTDSEYRNVSSIAVDKLTEFENGKELVSVSNDGTRVYRKLRSSSWLGSTYYNYTLKPHVNNVTKTEYAQDTMYVVIMATDKASSSYYTQSQVDSLVARAGFTSAHGNEERELTDGDNLVKIWQVTSSCEDWTKHSGSFTVPEGQYVTRLFLAAGATAFDDNHINDSIAKTVGNLLDDVEASARMAYSIEYYELGTEGISDSRLLETETGSDFPNNWAYARKHASYIAGGYRLAEVSGNGGLDENGDPRLFVATATDGSAPVLRLYYSQGLIQAAKTVRLLDGADEDEITAFKAEIAGGYEVRLSLYADSSMTSTLATANLLIDGTDDIYTTRSYFADAQGARFNPAPSSTYYVKEEIITELGWPFELNSVNLVTGSETSANKASETVYTGSLTTDDRGNASVEFINIYKAHAYKTLTVSKLAVGNMIEADTVYDFTLELYEDMTAVKEGKRADISLVKVDGEAPLADDNLYSFGLTGGESIAIEIPEGYVYTVREISSGYETSVFMTELTNVTESSVPEEALANMADPAVTKVMEEDHAVTFRNYKGLIAPTSLDLENNYYIYMIILSISALALLGGLFGFGFKKKR